MKRLEIDQSNTTLGFITPTLVREPLTESDILSIQDRFLTNGFQHIKVKDIATGRVLVDTFMQFLQSLRVYHDIACLTTSTRALRPGICDIYAELALWQESKCDLEEFFLDTFYFDFIWIEATKDMVAQSWYAEFERQIIELQLDSHIPIVVLWYEE